MKVVIKINTQVVSSEHSYKGTLHTQIPEFCLTKDLDFELNNINSAKDVRLLIKQKDLPLVDMAGSLTEVDLKKFSLKQQTAVRLFTELICNSASVAQANYNPEGLNIKARLNLFGGDFSQAVESEVSFDIKDNDKEAVLELLG